MLRQFILLILMLTTSLVVVAETAVTRMQRESNKGIDILPGNLSIGAGIAMTGTVSDESQSEGTRTASLSIAPRYAFDNGSALSMGFTLTQETEIERLDASNLSLVYILPSKSFFNDNLNLGSTLIAVAPTNGRAYRDESYRGTAGLSGSLSTTAFKKSFPLNLSYILTGGKLFHKYRRNNLRLQNTEYFVTHTGVMNKTISKVTLALSGSFRPTWTYQSVYKPTYAIGQSISYRDKGFTYTVSHSNGGSALDYQGDFDNVKPFDDYTSQISFSLGYRIN